MKSLPPKITAAISLLLSGYACWMLIARQMDGFADDPGLGWHLETGRWIVTHREIPRTDPFLGGAAPRPWVSDQWLSDVLFYLVYQTASWPGLYSLGIAVFICSYFCLLLPAVGRRTETSLAAVFAVLAAFKLGQIHMIARPVMFSFPFLCLLLRIIYKLETASDRRAALQTAYAVLPLMFALWANMHGGFTLGLLLLGLYTAVLCARRVVFNAPGASSSAAVHAAAVTALCSLATYLNPYGISLYHNIIDLGRSDYFMALMAEWRPLELGSFEGKVFLGAAAIVLGAYAVSRQFAAKLGLFQFAAVAVFAVMSLRRLRILPFWGLVAAAPLAAALALLASRSSVLGRLTSVSKRQDSSLRLISLATALLAVTITASTLISGRVPFVTGPLGPSPAKFPYGAIEFLKQNYEEGVIASHPDWGGFITLFGSERFKPVIDDRNQLLGENFYREYFAHLDTRKPWRDFLTQLQATHLLLPRNEPFANALISSGTVEPVYRDENAVLFALAAEQHQLTGPTSE